MTNIRIDAIAEDFIAQQDLDFLRHEKKNINVKVYFDNSVIRGMIQGIYGLENNYKIEKTKFDSPQTLVQSLAYFGNIKNIRILPPHQDELVDYLSKKHLLTDIFRYRSEDIINDLFYTIGLADIGKLREYVTSGNTNEYLSDFKNNSVALFKVNYLLKELNWNDRFKRLISFTSTSIVTIDETSYDLDKLISGNIFKQLVRLFDQERKNKKKNNLRDALTLALIKQEVDIYKEKKKDIPIFYASTNIIKKIKEHPGLRKEFDIEVPLKKGKAVINVLRDSYFFVLDSLFSIFEEDKLPKVLFEKIETLKRKFNAEAFNDIYDNSTLENEIEEVLFKDKFFIEFWFDRIKKEHLDKTIEEIVSYDFFKTNKQVLTKIEEDRLSIKNKLSGNLEKLKLAEDVWLAIDVFLDEIASGFIRKDNVNVFTDLGLTRFSVIRCEDIQSIVDTLLSYRDNKDDNDIYNTKVKLVSYVNSGINDRKYDDLLVAISVFWVFDKHDLIIRVLNLLDYDYGPYYQLALFHAASVYPANYKDEEIINNILVKHDSLIKQSNNYKLWIGEGFVYYYIWKFSSGKSFFPEEDSENSIVDDYIFKAIDKTTKAYDWLKKNKDLDNKKADLRNRKYYYSLNNLLYYKILIEPASVININSWEILAKELVRCKEIYKNKYWQARFDHTLAVYQFRLYIIKKLHDNVRRKAHLNNALEYIEESIKGISIHMVDYINLKKKIELTKEEDFPEEKNQ